MKKLIVSIFMLISVCSFAQEHFSGIGTSKRIGILNANFNPAELANLSSKMEVNLFATSVNISNNKIGVSDITGDEDFEDLIFQGNEPVNLRFDVEVAGPGFAFKHEKWGFAITSKAYGKLNLVDIDANIGDAIANNGLNSLVNFTTLNGNYNQRLVGITYGEIGLSAARSLWETDKYKLNGGATFKLLFPGSYANFGADQFEGTVNYIGGNSFLTNANASINVAYSGSLGSSFSDFDSYSDSVFGSLNGFAVDFGGTFTIKDDKDGYKFNSGISIRNIGGMTFKDENNSSTNYNLVIEGTESLDLSQFEDVDSLQEVEQILVDSGFLTSTSTSEDFKVKLPSVLNVYADLQVIPTLYVSVFLQQKLTDDAKNDQITAQNVVTLTPRFSLKNFEVFAPLSQTEIAGFNAGIGFRLYGFFIGSGSAFTALINDSKQADFYFGYRFGLGKS
ncbi:MAG TPA: hypothetical protein PLL09_02225 [Flavobacterium sp.]|uniref:hypothetical protein n=1 Tax=unclassified Flavobacterium TaxID=196869 RepID=UPI000E9CE039|nr:MULTISPECIES: hypothetical protein [unclassified Flavobacterium]HBI00066.1 hypothetical protein [Flavobacterium sp.]HRE76620.1 hypothetical protein [Flavobacterium sp.]